MRILLLYSKYISDILRFSESVQNMNVKRVSSSAVYSFQGFIIMNRHLCNSTSNYLPLLGVFVVLTSLCCSFPIIHSGMSAAPPSVTTTNMAIVQSK